MAERPVYSGIFEHIDQFLHMEENQPEGSVRWRELIEAEQYPRVERPVAKEQRSFGGPGEATEWVRERARALHADLVGVTAVNQDWVFQGGEVLGRWAVVVGVRMDFTEIMTAPDLRAGVETTRAYYALGHVVLELADELRAAGHEAWAHHPRFSHRSHGDVLFLPHAVAAGLGRLGRHGLVITPRFGPCVRFAAVTTDLDLVPDEPAPEEVLEACEDCWECRRACVAEAIPDERTEVRGVWKYRILPLRCAHEFARYDGCSKCIAACPFMGSYPPELREERPWTPQPSDGGPGAP